MSLVCSPMVIFWLYVNYGTYLCSDQVHLHAGEAVVQEYDEPGLFPNGYILAVC